MEIVVARQESPLPRSRLIHVDMTVSYYLIFLFDSNFLILVRSYPEMIFPDGNWFEKWIHHPTFSIFKFGGAVPPEGHGG